MQESCIVTQESISAPADWSRGSRTASSSCFASRVGPAAGRCRTGTASGRCGGSFGLAAAPRHESPKLRLRQFFVHVRAHRIHLVGPCVPLSYMRVGLYKSAERMVRKWDSCASSPLPPGAAAAGERKGIRRCCAKRYCCRSHPRRSDKEVSRYWPMARERSSEQMDRRRQRQPGRSASPYHRPSPMTSSASSHQSGYHVPVLVKKPEPFALWGFDGRAWWGVLGR